MIVLDLIGICHSTSGSNSLERRPISSELVHMTLSTRWSFNCEVLKTQPCIQKVKCSHPDTSRLKLLRHHDLTGWLKSVYEALHTSLIHVFMMLRWKVFFRVYSMLHMKMCRMKQQQEEFTSALLPAFTECWYNHRLLNPLPFTTVLCKWPPATEALHGPGISSTIGSRWQRGLTVC